MELNIDVILADLKEGKVPRTQQNLDKLNDILKSYAESGQRDFSITQIGRVSAERGRPYVAKACALFRASGISPGTSPTTA